MQFKCTYNNNMNKIDLENKYIYIFKKKKYYKKKILYDSNNKRK